MKPHYEKIPLEEQGSFLTRHFVLPYFDAPLHFHPEYELTLILKGYGKRFVGDSVENFEAGDLVLVGANLPHFWRCDSDFYQSGKDLRAEAVVVQFSSTFLENALKNLPECQGIIQLINQAQVGIHFKKEEKIQKMIQEMSQKEALPRLLNFIEILDLLAKQGESNRKLSKGIAKPNETENERMKRILEYTLAHFSEEISLEQVAEIAHLTTPAFCRYFKQRTKKTYVDYLNELRIGHARKLLIDNELSVSQVGLECGFRNLSHFHRIFKNLVSVTPMNYQKKWIG